jgi:hypothetical protein
MLNDKTKMVKDPWIIAVLYSIGGTILQGPWYERLIFRIFQFMAKSGKGDQFEQELRVKYLNINEVVAPDLTNAVVNGEGGTDHLTDL